MLYCEDCLARTVAQPVAAAGAGSPVLAALLGFIPGLGAVYNGEYTKAIVHVAIFAGLAAALSTSLPDPYSVLIGLPFAFFYLYMPIDAYRVAKARQVGAYVAPLGVPAQGAPTVAGAIPPQASPAAPAKPNWWVGPVILVGLGVLFLMGNFGLLEGDWLKVVGPVILILIGGWLIWRRLRASRSRVNQ